jgi:hypothetical protein
LEFLYVFPFHILDMLVLDSYLYWSLS